MSLEAFAVEIVSLAGAQFERERAWRLENWSPSAATALVDELDATIDRIKAFPRAAPVDPRARLEGVRRALRVTD